MNGGLRVAGLSLRVGAFALRDVDLAAAPGEILAVLGPNGAGKSLTLETVAGFHRPDAGSIEIAGHDVTALPPEHRQVSLVPQDYGLFPHLTVAQNVGLPMRAASDARRHQVAALLDRFGIASLAARLPRELSPGERQRTALARALAGRPRLFLFDEPFAALDGRTRETLRDELRAFLRTAGTAAVCVTHDLAEAMGLADRLVVMQDGRVLQHGIAEEVYRRPADIAAAAILGVENILAGHVVGRYGVEWRVTVGDIVLGAAGDGRAERDERHAVSLAIRAEDVALLPRACVAPEAAGNRLPATVRAIANGGALVKATIDCGFPLVARLTSREARQLGLMPGLAVTAAIAVASVQVLD